MMTKRKVLRFEVKAVSPCYVAAARGTAEPEIVMASTVDKWPVSRVASQALSCPGGTVVAVEAMAKAWEAWKLAAAGVAAGGGA